jgi:hypothetical protein
VFVSGDDRPAQRAVVCYSSTISKVEQIAVKEQVADEQPQRVFEHLTTIRFYAHGLLVARREVYYESEYWQRQILSASACRRIQSKNYLRVCE